LDVSRELSRPGFLESRRLNLGLTARLRGISAASSWEHRHSFKSHSLVLEVLENEVTRTVRAARFAGVMASATHPDVDYDKAVANGVKVWYDLLGTVPYWMQGRSSEDMLSVEREEAVKEYKRTCAMDEKDDFETTDGLNHKRIGDS